MKTSAEKIAALHKYAQEWTSGLQRSMATQVQRLTDAAAEFRFETVGNAHGDWQRDAGAHAVYALVLEATTRENWAVEEREEAILHYIRSHMMRMLTNGPDDSWSGRTNDARRAYHDGVRDAWGRVAQLLEG